MLPGLSATRMEVGPAATNLILIVMTATLLWRRAREVRYLFAPAARHRSEQTFT